MLNIYLFKPFLILLNLLFISKIFAQQTDSISPYLYNDTTTVNGVYGSAKQLKGKTLIINCFVSAGKYKWKPEEKSALLLKQETGLEWLKQEALSWGVNDLSFISSSIGLENDIQIKKIEASDEPKKLKVNWVPLVLDSVGIKDLPAFYETVKEEYKVDNVVVLIFAKERGRSYAQAAYNNYNANIRFLEGAVVYDENNFDGSEVTSATIIHEMLHLFGAKDIYISKVKDKDAEAKMRSVFPKSIMLETHRDIKSCAIEQLTAWCIGWTKSYWGWYKFF